MVQFAQIVFSCDKMHITPFLSRRHQTFVQVKNKALQTMVNVHTHENEDIFYNCHQDFTIWEFFCVVCFIFGPQALWACSNLSYYCFNSFLQEKLFKP
jgi:hypothetical protein